MFHRCLFYGGLVAVLVAGGGGPLYSQVLGPCGTADADKPAVAPAAAPVPGAAVGASSSSFVAPLPLPGQKAPNFELDALLPNDVVRKVKLSDHDGKWRLVCFYPADFTFV